MRPIPIDSQLAFQIRRTGFWTLVIGLLVLTIIFIVGGIATWHDVDQVVALGVLALWVIVAVRLVFRARTLHVSVQDGHLQWRVMQRWAKFDEPIASIVRIVLAGNGDLEVEFIGRRAPLRLTARKEYRAEDLRALARKLASDTGQTVVNVEALQPVRR